MEERAERNKHLLRNKENYKSDLEKNDVKETGLKKKSIFNKIKNFHVSVNLSFDIMHDVFHGVANYVLRAILYRFIIEKTYFTLETLNSRIQSFNFGPNKDFHKPPIIYMNHLKRKCLIKCSAAEMITLVRFLGIIIGDLIKNHDDDYWLLFKLLRSIVDIILSPRITKSHALELRELVEKLLETYRGFFGALKPKFHIMVHYATCMLKTGPLVNFWTMRFESRHRPLKAVVTAISSSTNLLVSIAMKESLKMCYMFHSFVCPTGITGTVDSDHPNKSPNRIYYKDILLTGSIYKKGLIVVVDISSTLKCFGEIQSIFVENNVVKFEVNRYDELYFDTHVHAYVLDEENVKNCTISFTELPKIPPCYSTQTADKHYVIPHFVI